MIQPPGHLRLVEPRCSTDSAGRPEAQFETLEVATDPLEILDQDHALQLVLCDALELIADGLPDHAEAQRTEIAISLLRTRVPLHMTFEDEIFFPALRRRSADSDELQKILAQLEHEHMVDHSFAFEIADELAALAGSGKAHNPEMLGYMLRGFFTAKRRHIEWESATVIPLARRVLTPVDLALLAGWQRANTAPSEVAELMRRLTGAANERPCSGTCEDCKNAKAGETTIGPAGREPRA